MTRGIPAQHRACAHVFLRLMRLLFLACLLACPLPAAADPAALQARFDQEIRPLLSRFCLDCHDAEVQKGDVDLSAFTSLQAVQANHRLWQTVLQQVEEEEMPPKKPLPSTTERAALAGWVRAALEGIDWSKQTGIARLTLPRLNKQEYNHSLRDLLGVDFRPGDLLLDDGPGLSGFTNDRDALFLSPAHAEQFFDAAEYALGAVLGLQGEKLDRRYEAEAMLMTERGAKPEELPGGGSGYVLSGGQRTLFDEIVAPVDGWYRVTVRTVGRGGDSGLRLRIDNEVRADFVCVEDEPQELQTELLLRAGSHQMTWNLELPRALEKLREENAARARATARRPGTGKAAPLPADASERTAAATAKNAPVLPMPDHATNPVQTLVRRYNQALAGMQRRLEWLRLVTPDGSPNDLRTYYNLLPERTALMAGVKQELAIALGVPAAEIDRRLFEANRERLADNQKVLADSLAVLGIDHDPQFLFGNAPPQARRRPGFPGIDWIRIEGPILPAGAQPERIARLFGDEARAALGDFLPRAFRRPLRSGELDRHFGLYEQAKARGESHPTALKLALTAALTSPHFLFRDELGNGSTAFKLNDHQLASRLSYFLWSSLPDDELRGLADAGRLNEPAVLRDQVLRLLADPRARAFTTSFLGEWLGFAGLGREHVPDARKFKDFTPSLAEAMQLEPVLVFERLLRQDRPLGELLDGRDSFLNAELAALYGIEGVAGERMRPVVLEDPARGGLLGMGAILTASATPNRTSPVLRGKWVLENLLGRHLAEPPADAGQLDDKAGERGKTLREELAEHRRHESCAGCHDKIDPIGFGLENFDAIGRFRTEEAGKPVNASGQLPGAPPFNGPAELRAQLVERHRDEFLANLTRRLASYALGRALRPQDEGLIRRLLADTGHDTPRAGKLVESLVLSEAFLNQGGLKE